MCCRAEFRTFVSTPHDSGSEKRRFEMTRLRIKLAASGLVGIAAFLLTSGVAEAKLAANHNDTVLRDR
jgi:hypothetical protein